MLAVINIEFCNSFLYVVSLVVLCSRILLELQHQLPMRCVTHLLGKHRLEILQLIRRRRIQARLHLSLLDRLQELGQSFLRVHKKVHVVGVVEE